jgi:hypothetical protein
MFFFSIQRCNGVRACELVSCDTFLLEMVLPKLEGLHV